MENSTGKDWLDAGDVGVSSKRYVVTWPHSHKTLKIGDEVVMSLMPHGANILVRVSDMTLHALWDEHDQYVHIREK